MLAGMHEPGWREGAHRCPPWCHYCPDVDGDVIPGLLDDCVLSTRFCYGLWPASLLECSCSHDPEYLRPCSACGGRLWRCSHNHRQRPTPRPKLSLVSGS